MNLPSTPVSFIRRSTISASFDVRISRNRRLASSLSRSFCVDQMQRALRRAHRVRMERQIVLLREAEDADQVDRVVLEHVRHREVDAVVVDDEIVAVANTAAFRPGRNFAIIRLSTGAGFACWSSSLAQRIAVRSPTSLAIRK